uniref:AP180 N-terminal homology (ANTH) domain-containing protein n=1 Tax=Ananas comosus var. bracteatus TaxID=296719 RepID=A0A6V7PCY3_ANACO|nr:unnamed protein product [Ananas comosus var. bracteatus]
MAPSGLKKALGAVKDQTSISIAKVSSNVEPELDVAVIKATSHDPEPADDKHLREILRLTSLSRASSPPACPPSPAASPAPETGSLSSSPSPSSTASSPMATPHSAARSSTPPAPAAPACSTCPISATRRTPIPGTTPHSRACTRSTSISASSTCSSIGNNPKTAATGGGLLLVPSTRKVEA